MTDQLDETTEPKTKIGRPLVPITADAVKGLGSIFATVEEMAAFFKCSTRTIKRRLKDPELKAAREEGEGLARISLRRIQWRHARGVGSSAVQMTIHLSKHHLGETDKAALELTGRIDSNVQVTSARERVTRKIDAIVDRITRGSAGLPVAAGTPAVLREPV